MSPVPIDLKLTDFPSDIGQIAQDADKHGTNVWMNETGHDPYLPPAVLSELTDDVGLGTRIATAFTRSPMSLAYTAWDLADHSNGRFTLGLGTQVRAHNKRRYSVDFEWEPPGPRLREVIQALRHIWSVFQNEGKELDFEGDYYSFSLMSPYFHPGPIDNPEIPILISGMNEYNVRLAGELCDGLAIHPFNSPSFIENVIYEWIQEGADKGDRSLDDVDISTSPFIISGATDEEIADKRAYVRRRIAFYMSTPDYKVVVDHHGWEDLHEDLHELSKDQEWEEMAEHITDDILYTFAVEAPYEDLEETIYDKWDGIVDRVVIEDALSMEQA